MTGTIRSGAALVATTLLTCSLAAAQPPRGAKAERTEDGRIRITSVRQDSGPGFIERQRELFRARAAAARAARKAAEASRSGAPAMASGGKGGLNGELPTPPLRIWSWQPPRGQATQLDFVDPFVRVLVDADQSPEASADRVIGIILNRDLQDPSDVAILLQHFGMGDGGAMDTGFPHPSAPALFWHWCDALEHVTPHGDPDQQGCENLGSSDASPNWWQTVWMSHGITESRAWMQRFIDRYKERQAEDPRIPDPSRFHFDSENNTTPRRVWASREFHAMKNDVRWNTEPIAGFGGRTMAQLYAEAGSPTVDPTQRTFRPENLAWRAWFEGVCIQAADAAMDAAAYEPIRQAWPDAKSSNWRTSDQYDGQGGRVRLASHDTLLSVNRAFGDMQGLVLYGKHPRYEINAFEREKVLGIIRDRIDDSVFSFGGPHRNLAPWTYVPGQTVHSAGEDFRIPEDQLRQTIVAMRSRGVEELLLWSDSSTQAGTRHWDDTADAIRDATALNLRKAEVIHGSVTNSGNLAARLAFRHRDPSIIASVSQNGRYVVELEAEFEYRDLRFRPEDILAAAVYANSEVKDVTIRLGVRNQLNRSVLPIGSTSLTSSWNQWTDEMRFESSRPASSVMLDRRTRLDLVMQFEATEPFTMRVDHVTAYIADPPPARE